MSETPRDALKTALVSMNDGRRFAHYALHGSRIDPELFEVMLAQKDTVHDGSPVESSGGDWFPVPAGRLWAYQRAREYFGAVVAALALVPDWQHSVWLSNARLAARQVYQELPNFDCSEGDRDLTYLAVRDRLTRYFAQFDSEVSRSIEALVVLYGDARNGSGGAEASAAGPVRIPPGPQQRRKEGIVCFLASVKSVDPDNAVPREAILLAVEGVELEVWTRKPREERKRLGDSYGAMLKSMTMPANGTPALLVRVGHGAHTEYYLSPAGASAAEHYRAI